MGRRLLQEEERRVSGDRELEKAPRELAADVKLVKLIVST